MRIGFLARGLLVLLAIMLFVACAQADDPDDKAAAKGDDTTVVAALADPHTDAAATHLDDASGLALRRTAIVRAVEAVSPAVVNITTTTEIQARGRRMDDFFSPLFEDFFNLQIPRRPSQNYTQQSLGSGVIIDGKKALVLTNAHVISGASSIKARLIDGREFEAELVGAGPDVDLAVLKLKDAKALPEASLSRDADLLIGETVIAIGNPYGYNHTVTTGVISAQHRSVRTDSGVYTDLVQTDAAINPGNSGGPLVNVLGRVIGITTAIRADAEGIGFAIPVGRVRRVVQQLVQQGEVRPVWLGLSGQDLDQRLAGYFHLPRVEGMLVTEVHKGTPAAKAGLEAGDLVLEVEGVTIEDKNHYLQLLRNYLEGQTVKLTVLRDGEKRSIKATLADFGDQTALDLGYRRWGFAVERFSRDGLIVGKVLKGSPAARLGMEPGDVVHKIQELPMGAKENFVDAVQRYRLNNSLLMIVGRQGRAYHVRLRI